MKFKVKINCPGFDKGEIYESDSRNLILNGKYCATLYPEIFEQLKEPLFVTYDGVELFENDKVFIVLSDFFKLKRKPEDCENYLACENFNFIPGELYFSSKEAAEKFINENKPVFSRKHISDAIDKVFHKTIHPEFIDSFKKELGI